MFLRQSKGFWYTTVKTGRSRPENNLHTLHGICHSKSRRVRLTKRDGTFSGMFGTRSQSPAAGNRGPPPEVHRRHESAASVIKLKGENNKRNSIYYISIILCT